MSGTPARVDSCHWLLLRLAGAAPDELVAQCRRWLGGRRVHDVGRTIACAVLSQRMRLTEPDIDLLAELIAGGGEDISELSRVPVSYTDPMPTYGFAPTRARIDPRGPAADRPPEPPDAHGEPEDEVDETFIRAVRRRRTVRAGWRCWRYPGSGALLPAPRRVFLVETDMGADLARTAACVQAALVGAGERYPQVEVYPVRAELPSYQRLARARGALLWARDPDPGVRLATPPNAAAPHNDNAEWAPDTDLIVAYLRRGDPLLAGPVPFDDAMDPGRGPVPACLRTDGFWIWHEASAHYLERYGTAPDPGLLAHIRVRRYQLPLVDGAALHRALAALPKRWVNQPTWTSDA